ncbi:MAG: acyl-CoA dehydrogenase family protein [Gordonia sp. (in: high G+C Gram-positive bacteria)]
MASAIDADDRAALADSVRDLLRRRSGSAAVRRAIRTPGRIDRPLWDALRSEIGVAALAVDDEYGGAGATFAETALVLEALGETLSPVPVFSSAVLAAGAVLASGDDDVARRLLPGLADGDRIGALCWAGPDGWSTPGVDADAGLLSGTAEYVLDGDCADVLLVLARGPGRTVTLHETAADAPGVVVTPLPVLDPTRALSRVSFDQVAATAIPAPPELPERIRTLAWAMLSAEQAGGAARALTLAVEHTSSRIQFGRPLASFQALKHLMADMYVLVEAMRAVSAAAADALATGRDDAAELAATAHVYCSEGFRKVAGDAIQLHGGIGMTAEHDIGLYFKRAQADAQLFGRPHEALALVPTDGVASGL